MATKKATTKKADPKKTVKSKPGIIGYKGFDKDLKCRDFQYEIGKTYETDRAELCNTGFHFCESPFDVFGYYPPANGALNRFGIIEAKDVSPAKDSDSKRVAKELTLKAEIGLPGIIKAGVEYILANIKEKTGDTGDQSASTSTGYRSASTSTGDRSASTSTGDRSASTSTGDQSASKVEGQESIALAMGYRSRAAGAMGCWIVLAEWDDNGHIIDVKLGKVDGVEIEPDVFYRLEKGVFVKADEDGR